MRNIRRIEILRTEILNFMETNFKKLVTVAAFASATSAPFVTASPGSKSTTCGVAGKKVTHTWWFADTSGTTNGKKKRIGVKGTGTCKTYSPQTLEDTTGQGSFYDLPSKTHCGGAVIHDPGGVYPDYISNCDSELGANKNQPHE
jgi:hypothetical protein